MDQEGKRLLKVVQRNSTYMSSLIDDLLEFSKLGRHHIHKSVINMHRLVGIVWQEIIDGRADKVPAIVIGDLPDAFGDYALLHQVMINLLSNAVKYSGKARHPEVEIGGSLNGQHCIYYVKDNGVGFDTRYVHKLFNVFQRLHKKEDFEGTGVGLAIVKRIIEKHGGKVWAEGRLEQGATFFFSLPMDEEDSDVR